MPATFNRLKIWGDEILTNEDLNDEIDNILENLDPDGVGGYSTNVSQMQLQTDPGGVGTENLADSLGGELERLRFAIARMIGSDYWYETPEISINELFNLLGDSADANRIISGRSRTTGQLIALTPAGSSNSATLKGLATDFIYYVDGTRYTIDEDVSITLSLAPASNNTCTVNLNASTVDSTFPQTKYMGELGGQIPFDAAGSEILTLANKLCAFKIGAECFIGVPKFNTGSSTVGYMTDVRRGFFFDDTDDPISRIGISDNDTITLLKLGYIFAKTDGTLAATYNGLVVSGTAPAIPVAGDYWFDTNVQIWKTHNGSSYVDATATFIGVVCIDGADCLGARSADAFSPVSDLNGIRLRKESNSRLVANSDAQQVSVAGSTIKFGMAKPVWDMAVNLDAGLTEAANTTYFMYLTDKGTPVISDVGPYERADLRGFYHPHQLWRCVAQAWNDENSHLINVLNYQADEQGYAVSNFVDTGAVTFLLHATPMKTWASHSSAVFSEDSNWDTQDIRTPLRVPFMLKITLPATATLGFFGGSERDEAYLYLMSGGNTIDLALSATQYANYSATITPDNATVKISSGATNQLSVYTNAIYGTTYSSKLSPIARVVTPSGESPGTWIDKWSTDLVEEAFQRPPLFKEKIEFFTQISSSVFGLATAGYATDEYAQLTNNAAVLPQGTYEAQIWLYVSSNQYSGNVYRVYVATANGDNTTTLPSTTGIQSTFGNDLYGIVPSPIDANGASAQASLNRVIPFNPIYFQIDSTQTIYINLNVTINTASTTAVVVKALLKRISSK